MPRLSRGAPLRTACSSVPTFISATARALARWLPLSRLSPWRCRRRKARGGLRRAVLHAPQFFQGLWFFFLHLRRVGTVYKTVYWRYTIKLLQQVIKTGVSPSEPPQAVRNPRAD